MDNSPPELVVQCVVSEPFAENTYVAWRKGQKGCVLCDPGLDPQAVIDLVERNGLTPDAILVTHGHADHIAGNGFVKGRYPYAPIVVGRKDAFKLTDAEANLSAGYGLPFTSPAADRLVDHGEILSYGGLQWEVRDTPGHSKGHVVFVAHEVSPPVVLGGDVLFKESIGRSDFPDGDFEELKQSIYEQLYTLPDAALIFPGHGPKTNVGHEKQHNPFVGLNVSRKWWEEG